MTTNTVTLPTQASQSPEGLAGRLADLAPENIRRMNRAIGDMASLISQESISAMALFNGIEKTNSP